MYLNSPTESGKVCSVYFFRRLSNWILSNAKFGLGWYRIKFQTYTMVSIFTMEFFVYKTHARIYMHTERERERERERDTHIYIYIYIQPLRTSRMKHKVSLTGLNSECPFPRIPSFPSPRPVAILGLKSSICPTIPL